MKTNFPPFLNGDVVRHTSGFLKAIGDFFSNEDGGTVPLTGIVTDCAVKFGKDYFISVQWSDRDSSSLVNPDNVERVN